MIGTILKGVAYTKAPKTTLTVRHPIGMLRLQKLRWDMRHAAAPRLAALGAAALALPLGIWLGRRGNGQPEA